MKKEIKRNLAVFFRQMVVVCVAIAILVTGGCYMKSIITFMGLRSEMEYIEEAAYQYMWTNELHDLYNHYKESIVNHKNPIVRWCYNYNNQAKLFTFGVVLLMVLALWIVFAIVYSDVNYCKRKKKRHHPQKG